MKIKSENKKKHIIESLKTCLARDVYSRVSLEAVAKEAGISKGGLRHHFPTSDTLYKGLIENFFTEIEDQNKGATKELDGIDKAVVSTLFNMEKFLYSKDNIRIFINILQYAFENEEIMITIKKFLRNHIVQLQTITKNLKSENKKENEDEYFYARMIQTLLISTGIFEYIDPTGIDRAKMIKYIIKLLKQQSDIPTTD